MRVNIYKRPEHDGQFSYLAVPEGQLIPQEATNVDWMALDRSVDLDEFDGDLSTFLINDPLEQIDAKGYAITSVKNLH
jgi:hypothetical protein